MDNQFKGKTTAGRVLARVFWVSEGMLLVEMFKCHNQFRAICGDMREVKTTTLKGLAKQENE
jgi:hypothetical protein